MNKGMNNMMIQIKKIQVQNMRLLRSVHITPSQ